MTDENQDPPVQLQFATCAICGMEYGKVSELKPQSIIDHAVIKHPELPSVRALIKQANVLINATVIRRS